MFDFFKDIFNAFRQSSLERIKSPFLGAFAFSWLGFNWQMIAILALSKDDILDRLNYINNNFDVGDLLLGPVLTTILICVMLPSANKLITKLQKNTNHDTNVLILQSKIDIATKQLEIAEFEAKKKLAEEREKKNIDADISAVIAFKEQLADSLSEARGVIDTHQKTIDSLLSRDALSKEKISTLEASLKAAHDGVEQSNLELASQQKLLNDINRNFNGARSENSKLVEELSKNSISLNSITGDNYRLQGELKLLKEQNDKLKDEVKELTVEITDYKNKFLKNNESNSLTYSSSKNNLSSLHGSPAIAAVALASAAKSPSEHWGQSLALSAAARAATENWGASSALAAAAQAASANWGQPTALSAAARAATEQWGASSALAAAAKSASAGWGQSAARAATEHWGSSSALAEAAKTASANWGNPTTLAVAAKQITDIQNSPSISTFIENKYGQDSEDSKPLELLDKNETDLSIFSHEENNSKGV